MSPPAPVRLAVTVLGVLAVLLAGTGTVLLLARTSFATRVYPSDPTSRADLSDGLLVAGAVFVGTALLAASAAVGLRRARGWARWLGLALGVVLGVLGLQSTVLSAGSGWALLLPVGAAGVAVTLVAALLNRDAANWVRFPPLGT